ARRITVNLAPADLPKEGSHYDLPIALGLMAAIGAIPADALSGFTVLGELGLDGSIAAGAGVLPAAIGANALRRPRSRAKPVSAGRPPVSWGLGPGGGGRVNWGRPPGGRGDALHSARSSETTRRGLYRSFETSISVGRGAIEGRKGTRVRQALARIQ